MIIEVVGKEIEKIKGDFESYLNGLNMVGEISYSQYSELYDEGTKQIQRAYELGKSELEKENAELKQAEKGKVVEHFEAYGQCRDSRRIAELEWQLQQVIEDNDYYQKENEELQEENTKAKELLKWFVWYFREGSPNLVPYRRKVEEAEQFLSEVGK